MGNANIATCENCRADKDGAKHTFFVCLRYAEKGGALAHQIDDIAPDNIGGVILLRQLRAATTTFQKGGRDLLESSSGS